MVRKISWQYHNITICLEDGGQIDVIYIDFEKAFDKVPHKCLLSKLQSYGIATELIKWIEGFLLFRWQQVRVNSNIHILH